MEVTTHTDAELAAMGVDDLWAHIDALQRFANRFDAYRAQVVLVAERRGAAARAGRRRMSDALAGRPGVSRGQARRAVHAAHTLDEHPDVGQAFVAGDITCDQVLTLGGARVPEPVRQELLTDAVEQTAAVTAAERAHTDADEVFLRQHQMRSVKRFTDRDGMWSLHARLTPDDGAKVDAVLSAHHEALWRHDKDSGRTQHRAPQQRLADAFVTMADQSTSGPAGPGPRATLNIVIPHTWLAEATDTCGMTTNGTTLTAQTLRRLACDAHILPTVLGGPSEILDVGRALRTATPAQRRGLEARDRGCFNCGAPAARCHVHHIDEWSADHGCTNIDMLVLACHDCHILIHEAGHTAIRRPDGRWTLSPSRGSTTEPGQAPSRHGTGGARRRHRR
jgi:hypothetical protein